MSTFTPSPTAVNKANERSWASDLGTLDWDTTRIVFTKRTLLEFLKYTGTSVDPNFSNISKLPRYCEFMTVSAAPPPPAAAAPEEASVLDAYRPSRRVRDPPGGKPTDIFGLNTARKDDDALAQAPPKPVESEPSVEAVTAATEELSVEEPAAPPPPPPAAAVVTPPEEQADPFIPSRRVRAVPGGHSTLGSMWGGEDEPEEPFKPTRKVRQRPGGQSNMDGIF